MGTNLNRIVVAGGTGLVGRKLVRALLDHGFRVQVLTRNPQTLHVPAGASACGWEELPGLLEGAGAVINLAGEGIAEGRWTAARKTAIRRSRLEATARLVSAMQACTQPPKALVNASAIGYYIPRAEAPVEEGSAPGAGFLAEVCQAWEQEAQKATALGVRVALIRIGVVLAREGGALPKMALPVRWFQGCKLGTGKQGLSWIHLDDLVAMLLEAARNSAWEGPFNGTAPQPLDNETFTRLLARELHRPLLPVPGFLTTFATKLLLGEMAEALLLQGAMVRPARAQALGFQFRFPTAEAALKDLL
ncbi:TIGR01777 family oxidoreductase [Geothrix sp. PMB-07]|uniref:TIGR01777 family oxidoreductase n=1 Tax=Geothrix sp. PMB-07 TaxID=3068640 RepID=UPI0027421F09|nr:TIGR01777 family oxidoreductase [Geothrix sp. PMB-07]WLT30475.1 TIGR01777 family oxidoreductase [Geothrix sp. PMB-07]